MPFPVNISISGFLASGIGIANDLKAELNKQRQNIAAGGYNAKKLLDLLAYLKDKADALDNLQQGMRLTGSSANSLSADLSALITSMRDLLSWADTNVPKSGEFLLLFSLDVDFNVVPRVFTGTILTNLDGKITNILTEIS